MLTLPPKLLICPLTKQCHAMDRHRKKDDGTGERGRRQTLKQEGRIRRLYCVRRQNNNSSLLVKLVQCVYSMLHAAHFYRNKGGWLQTPSLSLEDFLQCEGIRFAMLSTVSLLCEYTYEGTITVKHQGEIIVLWCAQWENYYCVWAILPCEVPPIVHYHCVGRTQRGIGGSSRMESLCARRSNGWKKSSWWSAY